VTGDPVSETDGERWIFLRGLTRESRHWGDFVERFRAGRPRAVAECLDAAGNGTERHRKSFGTIHEYVLDLRRRCQAFADGPVHLCAISLGGMIATAWASAFPGEVASLTIINTSAANYSPLHHRLQPRSYPVLVRGLVRREAAVERERAVLGLVSNRDSASLERWVAEFAALPTPTPASFARQVWAASRYRFPARAPVKRVLVLRGLGDRLVNPRCSEAIARAWDAPLESHPTAGHDLPLDDPEWVLARLGPR